MIVRAAPALGFAAAAILIVGGVLVYRSSSQPPKPWNTQAIHATFDSIGVEGSDHALVFYYLLENKTDTDYQIPDRLNVTVMSRRAQGTLSADDQSVRADENLFLPVGRRARFAIHTSWHYPDASANPPDEAALETYVAHSESDLNGFVLFDQRARYEIEFPATWLPGPAGQAR